MVIEYPKITNMTPYEDSIQDSTKWWQSYPVCKFNQLAKPSNTFDGYISQVFHRPGQLARSASTTNLTYTKEAECSATPIRRFRSFSALSPSHISYPEDRIPQRYIPGHRPYRPFTANWYDKAYAPFHYVQSLAYREPRYHIPMLAKRWRTPVPRKSYLQGSQEYLDRYVSDRMKFSDFAAHYTYRNYDQDINHRWSRFLFGSETASTNSTSIPQFRASRHPFRIFRFRERVVEAIPLPTGWPSRRI